MSAQSDARKLLALAEARGLEVLKIKHGGYAVLDDAGNTVTRIPGTGTGPRHWIKNARKAIEKAAA